MLAEPSLQSQSRQLDQLREGIIPLREQLFSHPLYARMETMEHLRAFLQHHVFAVWDFMSLLKWLQRELTCVAVPWVPTADPLARRLINEIVLEEESDEDEAGGALSHYEMYLAAMRHCAADTGPVTRMVEQIMAGAPTLAALQSCGAPAPAVEFVSQTWSIIEQGEPHRVAAAFALGREDVIPGMFRSLVADLARQFPAELALLHDYLQRHIELDEDRHNPLALAMLARLCGDSAEKWADARQTAEACLRERIRLWDGMAAACR